MSNPTFIDGLITGIVLAIIFCDVRAALGSAVATQEGGRD
jgi:hypothetical protein